MTQALMTVQQFNDEQLTLIRQTVAKGTTPEQFKLFVEVCKYHGLNPFARQIYAVVRNSKQADGSYEKQMTIQTSIDGYRLLAERSGKYAGQIGPQWCDTDGEWKDVWLSDKPPAAARIGVLRKDFEQPTWGVAKFKSYAQTTPLWSKMPDVMLAKCAESLALRKAFPAEMSGIYTKEEMEQASQYEDVIEGTVLHAEETHQDAHSNGNSHKPTVTSSKNGKATPAQPQAQPEPTIEEIITLCDTVYGSGKWPAVKARIFDPEQYGDMPDEMLSDVQKARAHGLLIAARQRAKAQADAAASAVVSK